MLAGSVEGWNNRKNRVDSVVDNMNLEIGDPTFQFPNTTHHHHHHHRNTKPNHQGSTEEDPAPTGMKGRERSISAPNVSQAIINADSVLPAELQSRLGPQKDIRSKYIHPSLDLTNKTVKPLLFTKSCNSLNRI